MKKKFFSFCILLFFPIGVFADFSDVSSKNEYFDAINFLQEKGIVQGYGDGTFRPDNTISRAEFTKIILLSSPLEIEENSSGSIFSDVSKSDWFFPYVQAAQRNKILKGYSDGTFGSHKNISFAEASKILVNTLIEKAEEREGDFWWTPFVSVLIREKALPKSFQHGISDEDIHRHITRGEMAEMIYRIKEKENNQEINDVEMTKQQQDLNLKEIRTREERGLIVVVDKKFLTSIEKNLSQWEDLIREDGIKVKRIVVKEDVSPEFIREAFQKSFEEDDLYYAVFIGDIPYLKRKNPYLTSKKQVSDKFYSDLDTNYELDGDIFFQKDGTEGMTTDREILLGHIIPPRGYEMKERADMINDYFIKVNNFKIGKLAFDKKVFFMDGMQKRSPESIETSVSHFLKYNNLYSSASDIGAKETGIGSVEVMQNYKEALEEPYELMFVNIHGGESNQQTDPALGDVQNFSYLDLKKIDTKPAIYMIDSCNNGDSQSDHYFAGELLFNGNTLQTYANTTIIFGIGANKESFFHGLPNSSFSLFANGGDISETQRFSNNSHLLFGDPTIRIRDREKTSDDLLIDAEKINFGTVQQEKYDDISKNVKVKNTGDSSVYISYASNLRSASELLQSCPHYMIPFETDRILEVKPNSTALMSFSTDTGGFESIGKTCATKYSFMTSLPDAPFFDIESSVTVSEDPQIKVIFAGFEDGRSVIRNINTDQKSTEIYIDTLLINNQKDEDIILPLLRISIGEGIFAHSSQEEIERLYFIDENGQKYELSYAKEESPYYNFDIHFLGNSFIIPANDSKRLKFYVDFSEKFTRIGNIRLHFYNIEGDNWKLDDMNNVDSAILKNEL